VIARGVFEALEAHPGLRIAGATEVTSPSQALIDASNHATSVVLGSRDRGGAPALGVQVKISDVGEVLVRSNVVLDRYWDNPDATAEALASGWFHTGDGGTIDDEGHLPGSLQRLDRAREAYSAIPVTHIVVQAQPRSAVSRPDGSTPELGQNWQEGSE
jgi:acyl-CoA synthetase (AMP-forming)/AMP-acid ligase II